MNWTRRCDIFVLCVGRARTLLFRSRNRYSREICKCRGPGCSRILANQQPAWDHRRAVGRWSQVAIDRPIYRVATNVYRAPAFVSVEKRNFNTTTAIVGYVRIHSLASFLYFPSKYNKSILKSWNRNRFEWFVVGVRKFLGIESVRRIVEQARYCPCRTAINLFVKICSSIWAARDTREKEASR